MRLSLKAHHRFLVTEEALYLQPMRVYRYKIAGGALFALSAFGVAFTNIVRHDIQVLLMMLGGVALAYALYDWLFRLNLTYVFDGRRRQVYRKFPGLFTQKLMTFDEVCILPETEHGSLRYLLSRRQNKFGKGYPVSDFFADNTRGEEKQEKFEQEILVVIVAFVEKEDVSVPNPPL